jgi:peptidoglycan/xylan/chitin deacetylase (PgdA/CDA1 family)
VEPSNVQRGFGPRRSPRAIVVSVDNLGEASELERGGWAAKAELGRHPSVTVALPSLLGELEALGLVATFFVEALNCELYPEEVREIAARGHELGVHGFSHERWAKLSARRERELLVRAGEAFRSLGLEPQAFRPPGGEATERTAGLLREFGYRWWSPLGEEVSRGDGLGLIPFGWELVDAYHLMDRFGELRARRGDRREPLGPRELTERLLFAMERGAGVQTLILHPFLMLDPGWREGARRVLALIAELGSAGRSWTVPGGELAAWLASEGR